MSSTTVKAIWPGERVEDLRELRNSWGSAPIVWDALCKRYLHGESWLHGTDALWELWKREDIPEAHRALLMWTFDRHYVKREDYPRMVKDIERFLADFPVDAGKANHWPTLIELLKTSDVPAMGLHCTSVSEDPFQGNLDDETGEYGPVDWEDTHDVYASLESAALQ